MSGCGPCTLCCTLMRVKADDVGFDKPAGQRCTFVCGQGCSIYERRPSVCQGFACVWLVSQEKGELALPQHERPDRTGIVLECNSKGTVIAHCKTPEAWKQPRNYKRLRWFAERTDVTIEHGNGKVSVLEKDGTTTELVQIGTADNGERKMVRRKELAAYYASLTKENADG